MQDSILYLAAIIHVTESGSVTNNVRHYEKINDLKIENWKAD